MNAVTWSKENKPAQKFLHVKLTSSKDKATVIIEGKTVCLFICITVISLAIARLFKPLVLMRIVACMW